MSYTSFMCVSSKECHADGGIRVHAVTVETNADVGIGVLHPDSVAATSKPTDMADRAGAVSVVNGDFFNNPEDHNSAGHTNAPVGPVLDAGESLTAAVPDRQRMGPTRSRCTEAARDTGSCNESVFGIAPGGKPAISALGLQGAASPTRTVGSWISTSRR